MKELSIEEKAKRYDESIERAKKINREYSKKGFKASDDVLYIFPELKESEDERIRKDIITYLSTVEDKELIPYESWVAWLEKQGEQKPTWSEEDEKILNLIIARLHSHPNVEAEEYGKDYHWLKSIKEMVLPQNIAHYNPYKEVVESIVKMYKHYDRMDVGSLQDFYDNVKVKCKDAKEYDSLFSQNRWKPSESDILLLEGIANGKSNPQDFQASLCCLIEQLKKLREE